MKDTTKDGWKSFRTDELDRARLAALAAANVGRSDGERLSLALECLVVKHGLKVKV